MAGRMLCEKNKNQIFQQRRKNILFGVPRDQKVFLFLMIYIFLVLSRAQCLICPPSLGRRRILRVDKTNLFKKIGETDILGSLGTPVYLSCQIFCRSESSITS